MRHDKQYQQFDTEKIEELRKHFQKWDDENYINSPENKLADLLALHPSVRTWAIDIGAGAGWMSAQLSKRFGFGRIIAIEPSQAALDIARKLYPVEEYPEVEWVRGFAEQELIKLKPNAPVLYVTGVVLSHLRDREVEGICKAADVVAPVGSILGFNDCWGEEWHQNMWHCRTKEWWQKQFPGWEFDFHGPEIPDQPGRHLGFHAVKRYAHA